MLFTRQIAKILAKYIEIRKRRKIRSCTILEEFLKPQLSILLDYCHKYTTHNTCACLFREFDIWLHQLRNKKVRNSQLLIFEKNGLARSFWEYPHEEMISRARLSQSLTQNVACNSLR